MSKFKKIILVCIRNIIKLISIINGKKYMKYYIKYLKRIGVDIRGTPNFISTSVYFDGSDYSKIMIGDNVTISMGVMLLTHDGAIHTVHNGLTLKNKEKIKEMDKENNIMLVSGIKIGKNTFVGAKASLLPGTEIGENVVIGAGSVVRGKIPNNSIVIGNPGKVVCNTDYWIDKKIEKLK